MRELFFDEMNLVTGASGCPIVHHDAGLGNGQTYYINPETGAKVMDPIPGSPGFSSSADYPAVNDTFCTPRPPSTGGNDPNGYIKGAVSGAINAGAAAINGIIGGLATGG
ncbi:hypothetical protein P3N87_004973 [Salmonella enterica]|nr:hypothetical protein [Salmonella enterica]